MTEQQDTVLIAVDGGGTGCRAAAGTLRRGILGEAAGGLGNVGTNFKAATGNIRSAMNAALAEAGLEDTPASNICVFMGLAGANFPDEMSRVAAEFAYGAVHVTSDRDTAVVGALQEADGFVVTLGTGTIVARQKDRVIKTVSGWGFHLSDQASGSWLGHQLLRKTMMGEDGMIAQSPLGTQVLAEIGGAAKAMIFSASAAPGDYAALARQVIPAAQDGDEIGLALMQEGAAFIVSALGVLGFAAGDRLCLSGGVGPHYAPYLPEPFTRHLTPPAGNALQGAFTLAGRAALAE
jgi:glucosamine kinase